MEIKDLFSDADLDLAEQLIGATAKHAGQTDRMIAALTLLELARIGDTLDRIAAHAGIDLQPTTEQGGGQPPVGTDDKPGPGFEASDDPRLSKLGEGKPEPGSDG